MIQDVLEMVKHWLFGQSIVILYETPVINKVYVLVCIYFAWRYIDHRCILSGVNSLKGVENKICDNKISRL